MTKSYCSLSALSHPEESEAKKIVCSRQTFTEQTNGRTFAFLRLLTELENCGKGWPPTERGH